MSPQEEETLTLAAITKLGEPTAHEIAQEVGCETLRHTLGRLMDAGRIERFRERSRSTPEAWVWCFRLKVRRQLAESKAA
jgi:hypothetical protein